MKKYCDDCKALDEMTCRLDYKTDIKHTKIHKVGYIVPAENCPKPKTNKEYIKLFNEKEETK